MSDVAKPMDEKEYNKFKSRTFWLTVAWMSFIPISVVTQALTKIVLPLGDIVMYAGLLTITYTGGNKVINWAKEVKKEI